MRVRSVLTASAALAVLFGGSYAQAATKSDITLDQVAFKVGSLFQPTQVDIDGIVYGVKATVHGTGSNLWLGPTNPIVNSATPGPCSGGWCDTPQHIASNNFGWDFHETGE